jgi:hypothetical protein
MRTEEIVSETKSEAHALTSFARVDGIAITYPPEDLLRID